MTRRWRAWWRLRSLREQRLLLVMAALLAITLAWVAVIRPLGDQLAAARADATRAMIATAETQALADTLRALERSRPPRPRAPVVGILTQAAAEAGFNGARVSPTPEGASVAIDSARPGALFAWIAMLEAQRGLVVERLGAQPTGDRALAATITFRERGR